MAARKRLPKAVRKPTPVSHPPRLSDETGLERLVFFSDAVFAIAITLLVLDIRLPELGTGASSPNGAELLRVLWELWPKYLAYVLSFIVIGLFWMNHHRRFGHIHAYDRRLIFINLLLLMAVAFLPFPTSVISAYANSTGVIFYALIVSLAGLLGVLSWVYAHRAGLLDEHLPPALVRQETLRGLVVPVIFLLSIPIALVNPDWAMYSWMVVALAWRLLVR